MKIFDPKNIKKEVKASITSQPNLNATAVTHDVSKVFYLENGSDSMTIGIETKGGQRITVNLDKK